jgi:hypothetical protein
VRSVLLQLSWQILRPLHRGLPVAPVGRAPPPPPTTTRHDLAPPPPGASGSTVQFILLHPLLVARQGLPTPEVLLWICVTSVLLWFLALVRVLLNVHACRRSLSCHAHAVPAMPRVDQRPTATKWGRRENTNRRTPRPPPPVSGLSACPEQCSLDLVSGLYMGTSFIDLDGNT